MLFSLCVFLPVCILDTIGLHRVENVSHTEAAVSLHLYSPPFQTCQTFDQRTGHRSNVKLTFWSKYGERTPFVRDFFGFYDTCMMTIDSNQGIKLLLLIPTLNREMLTPSICWTEAQTLQLWVNLSPNFQDARSSVLVWKHGWSRKVS